MPGRLTRREEETQIEVIEREAELKAVLNTGRSQAPGSEGRGVRERGAQYKH